MMTQKRFNALLSMLLCAAMLLSMAAMLSGCTRSGKNDSPALQHKILHYYSEKDSTSYFFVDGKKLEDRIGSGISTFLSVDGTSAAVIAATALYRVDANGIILVYPAAVTRAVLSMDGKSILSQAAEVKQRIGVSPQETAVAPNLTAEENQLLMCGVHGFSKEKSRQKAAELAEQLGLSPILHRRAGKLSGGWQRRLSIAMALVSQPEILFLDEPTLGLDVLARSDLWDTVRSLKGRITIVLTTHDLEEAEALSDRVGVMKDGRLLALGTPEELKRQTGSARFEEAFVKLVKEERA